VRDAGATEGMPKINTDIDACEVILQMAPETNGHVAVKAWEALGKQTGIDHTHLALHREDENRLQLGSQLFEQLLAFYARPSNQLKGAAAISKKRGR